MESKMLTEHTQMHAGKCERLHISACFPSPFQTLMKSTAVDESLSNTSNDVLFPQNTNQLQD